MIADKGQYSQGGVYSDGEGVAQSYVKAARWYRMSADQGTAESQCHLGALYHLGQGVVKNDVEAVRWFRCAADQHFSEGQSKLGVFLLQGKGAPIDLVASQKYLTLAAAQGNEYAQVLLVNAIFKETMNNRPPAYASSAACSHCGVTAADLKTCTRCRAVNYCGRECQAAHWKAGHKQQCKPPKAS